MTTDDITTEQITEWRSLRGSGMVSAIGEYTPEEFWDVLDALEDARAALPAAQEGEPWKTAIDEALIAGALDCIGADETAEQALARLVAWEVTMALDPAISKRAADLIAHERALADRLAEALERIEWSYGLLLARKPVRDVAETKAEAESALAAHREARKDRT